MTDLENFNKETRFVAKHFKPDSFKPLYSFGIADAFKNKRRRVIKWVAASVVGVTLSAAAIVITYQVRNAEKESEPEAITTQSVERIDRSEEVIRLEFTDAPLAEVVKGVEEAYGVTLTNVPDADLHLTLSYEGNARDFIDTVNELLGTDIRIEK